MTRFLSLLCFLSIAFLPSCKSQQRETPKKGATEMKAPEGVQKETKMMEEKAPAQEKTQPAESTKPAVSAKSLEEACEPCESCEEEEETSSLNVCDELLLENSAPEAPVEKEAVPVESTVQKEQQAPAPAPVK